MSEGSKYPETSSPVMGARMFVRAASHPKLDPVSEGPSGSQAEMTSTSTSSAGCPVTGQGTRASSDCPVVTKDFDPRNLMPSSSNETSRGQSKPLDTDRVQSSIPLAAENLPSHQQRETPVWVYPSEQMFYNAMKRKGWKPSEDDMHAVVKIHNGVNERAWSEVLRWEGMHQCGTPKLKRFLGRPQEYSPKARLLNFFGYKLPFDRHDWYIDRCGQEVRYVIDFYNAAPLPGMPVAMHLDVRPAIDSPQALWDRLKMQARWVQSGRWRSA